MAERGCQGGEWPRPVVDDYDIGWAAGVAAERERCAKVAGHISDLLTTREGNDGTLLVPVRVRAAILGHLTAIRKGE